MRPDLGDLLGGVQRLLVGDVVPGLGDPFLQEQAAYASLLLEYCRTAWARQHLEIAEESADLTRVLGEVAASLGATRLRDDVLAAALRAAAAAPPDVSSTPLDVVLERDRERRQLLERAVEELAVATPEEAGESAPVARRAIDGYLARSARRRGEILDRLGIRW